MKEEFELIAKTFQGLEEVLAKELTELGEMCIRDSSISVYNRHQSQENLQISQPATGR